MTTTPPTSLLLRDPGHTQALGRALGLAARRGDVLWLSGGLGAGKTCLAQGLGQGLEVDEALTSPTFGLLHEHRGRWPLAHADLYRLSLGEVLASGLEEAWLAPRGVTVVEWPEVLGGDPELRPDDFLWLHLGSDGDGRRLRAEIQGPRSATWWREACAHVAGH